MIARLSTRPCNMRRSLAALVALAVLAIVMPAFAQAQTPAPAHHPSPNAIALARQIIELKGADKTIFQPLVRGVIEKVKNTFMQTNFMWTKDLDEVALQLEREYARRADELTTESARIYASHFTEAELKQMVAFYQSPVGRKMIAEEPKALDEAMANAGRWGDNFSEIVIARMREEMKKRGHDL